MADVEKGKKGKRRRSLRAYQNMSQPVNPEAAALIARFPADDDADENVMAPDRVKATGNPVPSPGGRPLTDRGPDQPGPRALALAHENMRMGTTRPLPLFGVQINAEAFPADLAGMNRTTVAVDRLDAAGASGMSGPPANAAARLMPHIAPINATGPDGGHGLADVQCRPPMAMKNSERLEVMKRHLFPGSGGAR